MGKINFQNGNLVSKAKVEIDGVIYDVEPAQYEGTTPLSAETLNAMQDGLLELVFPIGSTYVTQTNVNPNSILGFGTWERLKGKVCLGLDEEDTDLNEIGKTGGEKEHTLTVAEMPEHKHNLTLRSGNGSSEYGITGEFCTVVRNAEQIASTGGNQPHNNMQPFEVVGYMWIRRA